MEEKREGRAGLSFGGSTRSVKLGNAAQKYLPWQDIEAANAHRMISMTDAEIKKVQKQYEISKK